MLRACLSEGVPTDLAWMDLDSRSQNRILGSGIGEFIGVAGFFRALEDDRYKPHIRILIAKYRGYASCPSCAGSGLGEDARAVRIDDEDIGAVQARSIDDLLHWIRDLNFPPDLRDALDSLVREIESRLQFLAHAGVGYLSLRRPARTLSGGEMHRVLLATSVGRMLTDTCYVLDEPTAGLHPDDTQRLMGVIQKLRDIGNTVIVVEHDPEVMGLADHIVELGPGGGEHGGEILFEGTTEQLAQSDTPTGESLRSRGRALSTPKLSNDFLTVSGVCLNNLRNVRASFPHGAISVVTGVSGSGKSTLVADALYAKLLAQRGQRSSVGLGTVEVHGDAFTEVVLVDQGSVQQSIRSCAMTFTGAYSTIRQIFASTALAQAQGLTAGNFSFNTVGGRCERCDGSGVRMIEMHFMADVALRCDVCDGKRFKPSILEARVRGKSIAHIFEMTVDAALEFFAESRPILTALSPLQKVGLGYLKLGQSTSAMSGGELQRLKLASYVGRSKNIASRLFIFDEPTVGLHMLDVDRLMRALRELSAEGNTIVAVEHNMGFVAQCDWIVDLGPGAGPAGGNVVYEGRVSGVMDCAESLTGQHLRAAIG
jgi:excinuclease ABC subunit A